MKRQLAGMCGRGILENKLPPKPTVKSLRSWDIPGKSPSDAASCHNGMFGSPVFPDDKSGKFYSN